MTEEEAAAGTTKGRRRATDCDRLFFGRSAAAAVRIKSQKIKRDFSFCRHSHPVSHSVMRLFRPCSFLIRRPSSSSSSSFIFEFGNERKKKKENKRKTKKQQSWKRPMISLQSDRNQQRSMTHLWLEFFSFLLFFKGCSIFSFFFFSFCFSYSIDIEKRRAHPPTHMQAGHNFDDGGNSSARMRQGARKKNIETILPAHQ